jgi:hypothetical protein
MEDLTIVYYTANTIPQVFKSHTRRCLAEAIGNYRCIFIYQPASIPRSHLQIYRNALNGALQANTKYIAFCEDDILYTKKHFDYRPSDGVFGYNKSVWSIYTWVDPPVFSWKDRRNMYSLICERDLFIKAMEERFSIYTEKKQKELSEEWFIKYWAEPGKYERQIGVTPQKTEEWFSEPPLVAFSHETALSFRGLGTRKKIGHLRSYEVPYWGRASDIIKYYK